MASSTVARNGVAPADHQGAKVADTKGTPDEPLPVGPHPGIVSVPAQYVFEQNIRQMQKAAGSDPNREDTYRLQGVQMIDNVRRALNLYVLMHYSAPTPSLLAAPCRVKRRLTLALQPSTDVRHRGGLLPPLPPPP